MNLYVYLYIYIYIHMYVHTYIYILYIHTRVTQCIYVDIHSYCNTVMGTNVYKHGYMSMYIYTTEYGSKHMYM